MAVTSVADVGGPRTITITAIDNAVPSQPPNAVRSASLTINAPLAVPTFTFVAGTVGAAYTQTIPTSGGNRPLTTCATTAALPPGLTIVRDPANTASNTNNCIVSGTPTTAGTFSVTVMVTDSASCDPSPATPAATCPAGSSTVTASGSANSAATTLTINKANTTTTITADTPDPSVVGEPYTVNFSVAVNAPGSGMPTGTVTVSDGAGATCTGPLTAGTPSTGSCMLASIVSGAKTLTATYNGDANFNASPASAGVPHQVNSAATTTTITSDNPDPSVVGQPYTVNVTVAVNAPGVGMATGTVSITDGTGAMCTATLTAGAPSTGSCMITSTSSGSKTLTATYSGDTNFSTSSDTEAHQVGLAATTTTITGDAPDPSVTNQAYTVNVTVGVNAPGTGMATGTVTITDGTGPMCTATLTAGTPST